MAVLIEGMEMPKRKMVVNIYADGRVTSPFDELGKKIGKAISVPEPHGRLGDLDAIEKQIDYIANLQWNKDVGASGGMLAALEVIEDAPTIIPASLDGEPNKEC